MAAKTTISLEEFLKLPEAEDDGTHYELDEGELITLSPGGAVNSILAANITVYLCQILDGARYAVLTGEPGVILSDKPERATVRGADVAVLPARPLEEFPEGFTREPFLLAVEIISKSNDPIDIERKKNQYLAAGVREVWLVYPKAGTIHVYRGSTAQVYTQGETFESALGVVIDTGDSFHADR
ncbi:MAG: Uma2 family endonuclease [Bryobacteraceae bacterium]